MLGLCVLQICIHPAAVTNAHALSRFCDRTHMYMHVVDVHDGLSAAVTNACITGHSTLLLQPLLICGFAWQDSNQGLSKCCSGGLHISLHYTHPCWHRAAKDLCSYI